jgi:hypothetical protein
MTTTQELKPWLSQVAEVNIYSIMAFFVFFLNESVRSIFVSNSVVSYFNLPFILLAGFVILTSLLTGRISPLVAIIALAFWCITFLTNLSTGENAFKYGVTTMNLLFPLLLTGINLDVKMARVLFTRFVKTLNVVMFLMLFIGILDLISGGKIQYFMIQHVFDPELAKLAAIDYNSGVYRFYFIFGHTLTIGWYMLLFFVVNVINNRLYPIILPSFVISAMTFVGLVLCNSRTALLIGIFMIIFFNRPQKKVLVYYLTLVLMLGSIMMLPLVQENILQRFASGIESGSVSGGRNEAVQMVFKGVVEPPGLLLGTGMGSSRNVTEKMGGFVESFEYPIIMFSYDFSIVGTVLLYLLLLILPILHFMQYRQWLIIVLFLCVSLYINGFNILSGYMDYMGQLCFVIMLLKNISSHTETSTNTLINAQPEAGLRLVQLR